jgi:hypothetical protein
MFPGMLIQTVVILSSSSSTILCYMP